MNTQPRVVLDSSALLAYLLAEPGTEDVKHALEGGAAISGANLAEVLSKMSDYGQDPDEVANDLARQAITGVALLIWPLDESQARTIARLRSQTRAAGLSLGDRACLALAHDLGLPVVTTDRVWNTLNLNLDIRLIR